MDFKRGMDRKQVFFTTLEDLLPKDSFAKVIDVFVDHLPMEELGFNLIRLNKEGNEPYHPKDMLKLLIYGQRFGIRSANQLARQCEINVEVKWLLAGLRPSPRKICYFRHNDEAAIKKAHRYFVRLLKDWSLVTGELMALDSTKVRGQNSLKNNFNQKKINRHLEYIDNKMEEYLDTLEIAEQKKKPKKERQAIEDKIEELENRRAKYEEIQEQVSASNDGQVSTTDPDSRAVIKHRNIVEVGYNIQTMVDAKHMFIVDIYAGGVTDRSDLGVAARRAQDLLEVDKIDLLADAGYHNGADIAYCERRGIRTFIPPSNQHYQKEEGFRKSDFIYEKEKDVYICPDGQTLKHELTYKKQNSKRKYRVKRYGTPMCEGCPQRERCTTSAAGRKIERPNHQPHVERNDSRVRRYRDYYRLRQQIVEPVFGVLKRQWHFDHLLLRRRKHVETEVTIAALTWNLMRLTNLKGIKWLEKAMKMAFFPFLWVVKQYDACCTRLKNKISYLTTATHLAGYSA